MCCRSDALRRDRHLNKTLAQGKTPCDGSKFDRFQGNRLKRREFIASEDVWGCCPRTVATAGVMDAPLDLVRGR